MENNQTKNWVGVTDGQRVWAVDGRTGERRSYCRCDKSPVLNVSTSGPNVTFATKDGKVRVWNPQTNEERVF